MAYAELLLHCILDMAPDIFGLADRAIIYDHMAAHGIKIGCNTPDVKVMHILDLRNSLQCLHHFGNFYIAGNGFQQDAQSLLEDAPGAEQDNEADEDADHCIHPEKFS